MWYSNYCDLQSRVALTYCYSFAVGSSVGKGVVFSLQAGHDKGIDFLKTYKITDQHASTPDCKTPQKFTDQRDPAERKNTTRTRTTANRNNTAAITKTQIFKTEKILLKLAEIMPLETDRTKQRHTTQKKNGRAVRMQVAKIIEDRLQSRKQGFAQPQPRPKRSQNHKKHRLEIKKQKHVALHARRLASTPSPSHAKMV